MNEMGTGRFVVPSPHIHTRLPPKHEYVQGAEGVRWTWPTPPCAVCGLTERSFVHSGRR